ncbi:MAG: hypothetical protein EA397_11020 [Deltaproteobacteria bacterium]|nr:MAG: hypothetical protein EA397_11020 [Deltaproteobacteria bacterium]
MSYSRPQRRPATAALRRSWAGGALLLGLMGAPAPVVAGPPGASGTTQAAPAPMKSKVEIEVMVVHATNAHSQVDPRLKPVLQHLKFLQFEGFQLISLEEKHLAVGSGHTFEIVGDRQVKIDVIERNETQVKLRVRMSNARGMFLDTTIRIHRNKSFMVGGPDHDGGKLLLPITAHY